MKAELQKSKLNLIAILQNPLIHIVTVCFIGMHLAILATGRSPLIRINIPKTFKTI
jgi:hypothetical protein